jgi:hypothetical protein
MGFRALRVINEDRVCSPRRASARTAPGHGDRLVRARGRLEHRLDGHRVGDPARGRAAHERGHRACAQRVQRLATEPRCTSSRSGCSPRGRGIAPGYEQKSFSREEKDGRLRLVASPDGGGGSVTVHTDARLYAGLFASGQRRAARAGAGAARVGARRPGPGANQRAGARRGRRRGPLGRRGREHRRRRRRRGAALRGGSARAPLAPWAPAAGGAARGRDGPARLRRPRPSSGAASPPRARTIASRAPRTAGSSSCACSRWCMSSPSTSREAVASAAARSRLLRRRPSTRSRRRSASTS